jgi:CheY-like chemotaxis protein
LEVFRADVNLKQIPVVAITANAMLHDIERDRAADFTDYLSKPLDFGQFLTTIDRCLGGGEENANHAGRTDSR